MVVSVGRGTSEEGRRGVSEAEDRRVACARRLFSSTGVLACYEKGGLSAEMAQRCEVFA